MNTTETTVTTKSIRTLAGELLEARRKAAEATKAADFLNKSLDAAPKTPKGKDTKATKAAREHVNNETAKFNEASCEAYEAFTEAIEKHAKTYVSAITSPFHVKNVLSELNYCFLEDTTNVLRESTKAVHEHNQKVQKRSEIIHNHYVGPRDLVFSKIQANLTYTHIVIRVVPRQSGVTIEYVGSEPVETKHGFALLDDSNSVRSFNGFTHGTGTVNLSSIGDETFAQAERRLKNTLEAIEIQRHIDKKIPIADIHDSYAFRARHIRDVDSLASFIVNEPTAYLGFKVVDGTKVEAVAFIPNTDTDGIVYSTDANEA